VAGLVLLDNSLSLFTNHGQVSLVTHGELTLTLSHGTKISGITEHLSKRNLSIDDAVAVTTRLDVSDHTLAASKFTDDVTLELFGDLNLDIHDRLEDDRRGLSVSLLETVDGSETESNFVGIDGVSSTIDDGELDALHHATSVGTLLSNFFETLLDGGNEFRRNVVTRESVDELVVEALLSINRLDVTNDAGELTGTTGLLLVEVVELGLASDGLAVVDLGETNDNLAVVLTLDTLAVDFKVQFTHTRDDGLTVLLIGVDAEGGIFLDEALESLGELAGILGVLGVDSKRDDGLRNLDRTHGVLKGAVSEGGTRVAINTEESNNLTSTGLVEILHFVGVHAHETGNLDLLAGGDVHDGVTLADGTLIHAEIGELTETVLFELEGESDERISLGRGDKDLFLVVGVIEGGVRDLGGVGEVVDDTVEERLDTLVLEGRTHEDWDELGLDDLATNSSLDLLDGGLLISEEELGDLLIDVSEVLNHDLALLLSELDEVLGNVLDTDLFTVGTIEVVCLAVDDIDDTLEAVLSTDRDLHGSGVEVEHTTHVVDRLPGVSTHTIELVDESKTRDVITLHLTIDSDGLGLHTSDTAEDENSTIQDTKSTLDFDSEIDVTGGINDVNLLVALPLDHGSSGLNGNTLLTLKLHVIHLSTNTILTLDIVNSVNTTSVEKKTLRKSGLTRVNVSRDTDVTHLLDVVRSPTLESHVGRRLVELGNKAAIHMLSNVLRSRSLSIAGSVQCREATSEHWTN